MQSRIICLFRKGIHYNNLLSLGCSDNKDCKQFLEFCDLADCTCKQKLCPFEIKNMKIDMTEGYHVGSRAKVTCPTAKTSLEVMCYNLGDTQAAEWRMQDGSKLRRCRKMAITAQIKEEKGINFLNNEQMYAIAVLPKYCFLTVPCSEDSDCGTGKVCQRELERCGPLNCSVPPQITTKTNSDHIKVDTERKFKCKNDEKYFDESLRCVLINRQPQLLLEDGREIPDCEGGDESSL